MLNIDKTLKKFATYCGFKVEGERRCDPIEELNKQLENSTLSATPLADLLPYDYYDEKANIVYNRNVTCGFWFEINPLVGSGADIEKNLTLFFNDELPDGMYLQFLIIAGHDISDIIKAWEAPRVYGGKELAQLTTYRKWFIQNCAKDFALANDGRLARNYRTFISCSKFTNKSKKSIESMASFQRKLENKLKTEKLSPKLMKATDLIEIGKDLLQMDLNPKDSKNNRKSKTRYSPYNNLSDQICSPLTPASVEPNFIDHKTTGMQSRLFYPKELPQSFSLSEMIALLGTEDKVIPARFVISYQLASSLGPDGTSKLISQAHRSMHAAERDYTRNDIGAKEQAREWREVLNIHKKGEKFLSESMLVMITAPSEDIDIAEESLKSIWNAYDWKLAINNDLQLLSMLAILPMAQAGLWKSLSFFKLTRNALSGEIVAKLPVQGEWKGVPTSGVLMIGRRGQLFNFNPFYRIGGGGNYNIAMMAPSGSGKSFFLQELATSMLAQDVAVFVMDIGASYKNICHLLGGEMVRFNKSNKLSLNPFAGLSNSGAAYTKALELIGLKYDIETIVQITGLTEEKVRALEFGKSDAHSGAKETDAIEILEIKGVDENGKEKVHFVTKDSIVYAKALLSSMCGVCGDSRGEALIERAIGLGVAKHGTDLDITKLTLILENLKDERGNPKEGASRLADSLYPYTEDGIHGRFFKAGQEVSFNEMLTVFEFEELVNDEPLLTVVLQIILMQITM